MTAVLNIYRMANPQIFRRIELSELAKKMSSSPPKTGPTKALTQSAKFLASMGSSSDKPVSQAGSVAKESFARPEDENPTEIEKACRELIQAEEEDDEAEDSEDMLVRKNGKMCATLFPFGGLGVKRPAEVCPGTGPKSGFSAGEFSSGRTSLSYHRLTGAAKLFKQTHASAGLDLSACRDYVIPRHEACVVDTGICLTIPSGCEGRISGRSSTFTKRRLLVVTGVIDSGVCTCWV